MELLHAKFVDSDDNILRAEEQAPVKDMPPEITITVGQRTAVTFCCEDVRSLHTFLGRFLAKHDGKDGAE